MPHTVAEESTKTSVGETTKLTKLMLDKLLLPTFCPRTTDDDDYNESSSVLVEI